MQKRSWMSAPGITAPTSVVYRGEFYVDGYSEIPITFSADERCQLYCDGVRVAEGPERGAPERWYSENVLLKLTPGKHFLCARVFSVGSMFAFHAQMSCRHGFYISGLEAQWRYREEKIVFSIPFPDWGAFPRIQVPAGYEDGILKGEGENWEEVIFFEDTRPLFPPDLPPRRREKVEPEEVRSGVWRFKEYMCVMAVYHFSGQGTVRIRWSETPYQNEKFEEVSLKGEKGDRNGSVFVGNFDVFEVSGAYTFPAFWFKAGRYVEIYCTPGVRCRAEYFRTGYPVPEYKGSDPLAKAAWNTLANCCFETFMDCPHYEQLAYIGDTRIEALCLYNMTGDIRLNAKALRFFALGQKPDGRLRSQYPSRSDQHILSFMPVWLLMLNDYCKIMGRDSLVRELLPSAEKLLGWFRSRMTGGFLPESEWSFFDWVKNWPRGVIPGEGPKSPLQFLLVLALRAHGETTGDPGLTREAEELLKRIRETYYVPSRGMFADTPDGKGFSEHAQVLALLCGVPEKEQIIKALYREKNLAPCSIYFSFYYMSACRMYALEDLLQQRIGRYREVLKNDLTTLPEEFDEPRSDCHAWSSNVMFFL